MAFLLSAGSALAHQELSSERIAAIGGDDLNETEQQLAQAIPTRYTVVDPAHLEAAKNEDVWATREHLLQTPTDLAYEAAMTALKKAGLKPTDLGLIIGACSTPLETTPSESQRLGQRLGVKIPAYDVYSGGADLSLYLRNFSRWKKERTPKYVMFFSTHCPTSRIDYRNGHERFLFSDGAGALLCSLSEAGPYQIASSVVGYRPTEAQRFKIELYGHLSLDKRVEEEVLEPELARLLASADLEKGDILVENQLSPLVSKSFLKPHTIYGDASDYGLLLGAGPFVALAEHWEELQECRKAAVLSSGIGLSWGVSVISSRSS